MKRGLGNRVKHDLALDANPNIEPKSLPECARPYAYNARRGLVAQICNLPYRRFVIGRASESFERTGPCPRAAECNSAIQQITNLRYERVLIVIAEHRRPT